MILNDPYTTFLQKKSPTLPPHPTTTMLRATRILSVIPTAPRRNIGLITYSLLFGSSSGGESDMQDSFSRPLRELLKVTFDKPTVIEIKQEMRERHYTSIFGNRKMKMQRMGELWECDCTEKEIAQYGLILQLVRLCDLRWDSIDNLEIVKTDVVVEVVDEDLE